MGFFDISVVMKRDTPKNEILQRKTECEQIVI